MEYVYETKGVCARKIKFNIEGNKVTNIQFLEGGCNGNLKALSKILEGWTVEEIEEKLKGNECGTKGTSCADQLAYAVREAYNKNK